MRKTIVASAIAACLALPGMASETLYAAPVEQSAQQIDQQLLEQLLRQVEQQTDYSYACLCDMYAAGEVEIWKAADGTYEIVIESAGGGLAIILIEAEL